MKKVLTLLTFTLIGTLALQGQENLKFGLTAGLLNNNTDIKIGAFGFDVANIDAINETGFYIGGLLDIQASANFHIQPELTYGKAGDLEFIYLPIMAKYYVVERLNIQAGPQFSFSTNLNEIKRTIRDIEEAAESETNIGDAFRTTGIDLGFGMGYDISDRFFAQARYAFELTNRYNGPLNSALKIKPETLMVGIGFKF